MPSSSRAFLDSLFSIKSLLSRFTVRTDLAENCTSNIREEGAIFRLFTDSTNLWGLSTRLPGDSRPSSDIRKSPTLSGRNSSGVTKAPAL